jgi:hypothetical protein
VRATARPTDTAAERIARTTKIRDLEAQIAMLGERGGQDMLALTTERQEAELRVANQLRTYDAQRLTAIGQTLDARLEAIDAEAEALKRLPLGVVKTEAGTRPETRDDREAKVNAVTEALKTQARLQQTQGDIARLQQDLDTKRLAIQQDLAAGRLNEVEAVTKTATAEREALPAMQQLVTLALQFAAALGDEGALANLRNLEQMFRGLGNALSPLEQRMQAIWNQIANSASSTMDAVAARIEEMLAKAGGVVTIDVVLNAEALTQSAARVDQTFGDFGQRFGGTLSSAIAAAASGGSGKDALLAGLGGIFQEMGAALLTYGLTMAGLLPSLLNPFTSGPAAIAAGAALVALGGALGALASGRGAPGNVSSGRSVAATPISISRLIVDPNAGVRQRVAAAGQGRALGTPAPLQPVNVIGIGTPMAKQAIALAYDSHNQKRQ